MAGFQKMEFQNCAKIINGILIPILCLQKAASEYINQKGYYSLILQSLVDYKDKFMNTNIVHTGKDRDARVLKTSELYLKGEKGTSFHRNIIILYSVSMPTVILGDPTYMLLP